MATGPISIQQVTPETERASVIRLLKENLPAAATNGRFEWAYLDNPHGVAHVWLARTAEGEVVGTSAAFPRQFRVRGNPAMALVLSDFVIDSRFRSLGPAVKLLRATLAPVDDGSFDFALDHPSGTMLAVYNRLGAAELGRQTRYVRLLKVSGVARRHWGSGRGSVAAGSIGDLALDIVDRFRRTPDHMTIGVHAGPFDESFANVGQVLEHRRSVYGDRCLAYLSWRYRSGIRFAYSTVTVRSSGELLAYAIVQHTDQTSMTIVEFMSPADAAVETSLFNALIDVSRRCNVELLQASCVEGSAWCAILKRLGFTAREQSSGPVVYAPKQGKWADILTDKESWWVTDGDRDG